MTRPRMLNQVNRITQAHRTIPIACAPGVVALGVILAVCVAALSIPALAQSQQSGQQTGQQPGSQQPGSQPPALKPPPTSPNIPAVRPASARKIPQPRPHKKEHPTTRAITSACTQKSSSSPSPSRTRDGRLIGDLRRDEFRVFCKTASSRRLYGFLPIRTRFLPSSLIDDDLGRNNPPRCRRACRDRRRIRAGRRSRHRHLRQFPKTVSDFSFNNDLLFTTSSASTSARIFRALDSAEVR